MKEEIIKFTPVEFKYQKPIKVIDAYLKINDSGILLYSRFYADEIKDDSDESLGWNRNVLNSFEVFVKKPEIIGLQKSIGTEEIWYVMIVAGMNLTVWCNNENEATELYEKLYNWINEPEIIFSN